MKNNNAKLKTDLKQRAYIYSLQIIKFIDSLEKHDLSSQVISKQLLRSATSIGANIVEAQAGRTKKDFANFFTHALKSANESKFWLGLLRDSGKSNKNQANQLLQETVELANILGASILTLKGKRELETLHCYFALCILLFTFSFLCTTDPLTNQTVMLRY